MAAVALTAALTVGPMPFAHSAPQLEVWEADWHRRVTAWGLSPFDPSPGLMAELADMKFRHHPQVIQVPVVGPAFDVAIAAPASPGIEQWRPLVAEFFPPDLVALALKVMDCESGGDPAAFNPSGASGLFQHMPRYWSARSSAAGWGGADIFDPRANVAVAAHLATTDGWWHWNPSRGCWS